jgi:hypothetical protein
MTPTNRGLLTAQRASSSRQTPVRGLLDDVRRAGFARWPQALGPAWRLGLLHELKGRRFQPLREEVGPVRQRGEEMMVAADDPHYPVVAQLVTILKDALTSDVEDIAGLERFSPNQAVFLRYRGPGAGISPHRDHKRYALLVAAFTLAGKAQFSIVADRAGQHVLASWMTTPGDLCLLRAPGFDGHHDGRPLHAVGAPVGDQRLALTLRMETTPAVGRDGDDRLTAPCGVRALAPFPGRRSAKPADA